MNYTLNVTHTEKKILASAPQRVGDETLSDDDLLTFVWYLEINKFIFAINHKEIKK